VNLDDRLRSVPGFTLFRRSSSLAANPTTQGVSLRGLGSSGASRTLVLWDGIPINDPFGGWVYWTRVAPEQLDRVEVYRGASTSVFGDRAMSGAIALFSPAPEARRVQAFYEGGNRNTHVLGGGASHVWSRFAASANVRAFTTDGYYVVPENRRGLADAPAGVRFVAGDTRLDYLGSADRLFLKFDVLAEERANGTALVGNSTGLGNIAAHYSRQGSNAGGSLIAYHTREQYRASFSSLTADRNIERITFRQTVPSDATGAAGMVRVNRSAFNLLAGADMQRVEGYSTDRLVPTGMREGGGSQLQHGTFVQLDMGRDAAKLFLGARHQFTGQDSRFFSPSAGFALGRGVVRARGNVYRSFRAPTLNELFREFRVANTITQANAGLTPEKLFGAEAGIDISGEQTRASVTVFRHDIRDIITNVTLSASPAQILRQRRNAASALSRGLDAEVRRTFGPVEAQLSYLFADSRFSTRERIPQVPRHHGNAQLTYQRNGTLLSAGVRSYSLQFEDDRNQVVLPGFSTVQFSARRQLVRGLSAQFALENLFDREYFVGPLPIIGPPRLWRVGLRWSGSL
jgi:outer membrane cobalamin receptor